jgi:hypothetical protein
MPIREKNRTAGATGATGAVTVSRRKKRRSPGNALILVVIGFRIERRESPARILLGRLLAVPSGRAAGGGKRWQAVASGGARIRAAKGLMNSSEASPQTDES